RSAGVVLPSRLDVSTSPKPLCVSRGDADEPMRVDACEVSVGPGDQLLLCSDGLWQHVDDPDMETILRTVGDPCLATQALIREASDNGCEEDDISAIVVHMLDERLPEVLLRGL